jgi:hypothetical protein
MKFANVLQGKRAERRVTVPGFFDAEGKPFEVLMVPITGLEYESACAAARARAIEKGTPDPKIGDPVYDLAQQAFILAAGCLDCDSPEHARTPAFQDGIEILKNMHPETIVYLHEMHEAWQDDVSPYSHKLDGDSFMQRLREVAGPNGPAAFMGLSPSTRLNFGLSTARMLLPLLEAKFSRGSTSESSSTTDGSSEQNPSENKKSDGD